MVAHHIDIVGVVGSSPASPTIIERGISLFFLCGDENHKSKICKGSSDLRAECEALTIKDEVLKSASVDTFIASKSRRNASPTIIKRGISLFFCAEIVLGIILSCMTVRVLYLMGSGTQILYLKFYLQLFCANI